MTSDCLPLMRPRSLRGLVAIALVGAHLAGLALAIWFLVWLFALPVFAAMFVLLLAACVAAKVLVTGRWSRGLRGGVQVVAVVVLCASYVVVGALAIASAIGALASQPAYATPRSAAVSAFLIAAIAAAATAAVIVSIPMSRRRALVRRMSAIVVMIGAVGAVGGAVAAGASPDPCEAFDFDRARWRAALGGADSVGRMSEAERIARAIERCRTVDGASRAKVRALLGGSQSSKRATWRWSLGTANDALGPGDGQDLVVEFGRTGRAHSVYLTFP